MATRDSDSLFDLRTVKRNIRAGRLSRTVYAEFLESLPDMADNVLAPEEYEAEDAFEDIDSPEPDIEESEVQGASAGSTTFAESQVPATVPPTPTAPEAVPVKPTAAPLETAPVRPPATPMETAPVQQAATPQAAPAQPLATPAAAPLQPPARTEAAPVPASSSSSVTSVVPDDEDPFADAPLPGQLQPPPATPPPAAHPAASDDHEPDGD